MRASRDMNVSDKNLVAEPAAPIIEITHLGTNERVRKKSLGRNCGILATSQCLLG